MSGAMLGAAIFSATPAMASASEVRTAAASSDATAFEGTKCEPNFKMWKWSSVSKPWAITHAKAFENFSGATIKRSYSVTHTSTVSASAKASTGVKFSANTLIAKLEGNAKIELAASGKKTNTSKETVSGTMKSGNVYVYFAGVKKVSGRYVYSVCNSRGTQILIKGTGKATSFGLRSEGVVRCGSSPKSTTLAYKVAKAYC
nr:hypothetical protein Ade03nite_28190 [Actinoplanes derwentensis]